MKKVNKLLMVVALAAITMLSSCIKNEVAPEVKALREAQLAMITAKIEMQNLLNEQQRIENEIDQSNATLQVALDGIALQVATANLAVTLRDIDEALLQAEEAVQQAELDLQEAIDALALYLATNGLEEAADYLSDYSDFMGDYFDNLVEIYGQEASIAGLEAALAQADYVLAAEILQRDLDDDMSELAALEALLTALESAATDPTTVETALQNAIVANSALAEANAQLEVDAATYENETLAPAWNAYYTVVGGALYNGTLIGDGIIIEYMDAASDVIAETANLAEYTAEDTQLTEELAAFEALLATNTANYEAKKALSDATEADELTKGLALVAASNAIDVALTDAGINGGDWADARFDNFIDAEFLVAAEADLTAAEADLSAAETDLAAAQILLSNAQDAIDTDAGATAATLAAEQATLGDEPVPGPATGLYLDVETAQNDYDGDPTGANLTALNDANTALSAQLVVVDAAQSALDALNDPFDDATDLVNDANTAIGDANAAIATAEGDVASAQADFDASEAILADEADDLLAVDPSLQGLMDTYGTAFDAWLTAAAADFEAQDITDTAEGLMDDIQDEVDNINDDITNNLEDLADAQANLAIAQGIVSNLQADFDAVDPAALFVALQAADDVFDNIENQIDINDDIIDSNDTLIDALEGNLDDINSAIEDTKDDIEGLKETINDLEKDLADSAISEAELTAEIAAQQVYLATLQDERDANLALADEYWALYLAAIGG